MREVVILKETKFCEPMEINGASPEIFSLLIEHTSYLSFSRLLGLVRLSSNRINLNIFMSLFRDTVSVKIRLLLSVFQKL